MPEYEKDTLYCPETKKSGSLAYKIGQAIAILMSLCFCHRHCFNCEVHPVDFVRRFCR